MQKQRSPYTSGGINVHQFKGATLNPETLGRMPFLMQFGQQGAGIETVMSTPMNPNLERGQRSGTPRFNLPPKVDLRDCYNGHYEGDIPQRVLDETNVQTVKSICCNQHENFLPMGQMLPVRRTQTKSFANDTDSENEYEQTCIFPKESRFYRGLSYIKARMPLERQERLKEVLKRYHADTWLVRLLLTLQLLAILTGAAVEEGVYLGINVTQLSFRLWRCKFQLRSLLRQLLWRMAGAKGNDALLFLGVLIISPWLFLISLVGFAIALVFLLKDVLKAITFNFIFN